MPDQSGCPFGAERFIGDHIIGDHISGDRISGGTPAETRDRDGCGRERSTWAEARAYLELFHREKRIPHRLAGRLEVVRREIDRTGTYWQTVDELTHGARVAWRNSNRCIGRLYWETLRLRDMR